MSVYNEAKVVLSLISAVIASVISDSCSMPIQVNDAIFLPG